VFFGRCGHVVCIRRVTLRLLRLLTRALSRHQIRGDHGQHLVRMIAQRFDVHRAARR
jgi:hypothetical protein